MIALARTAAYTSRPYFAAAVLMVCYLLLAGCGSTKVYTADKTMVYNGNLYNLTQVSQIGSKVDLQAAGGEVIDAGTLDKKGIQSLLKENKNLMMTTQFMLDDKPVVYERVSIDSYSGYSKHVSRFDKAKKKLASFMSDAKATQLKLD